MTADKPALFTGELPGVCAGFAIHDGARQSPAVRSARAGHKRASGGA